MPRTSRAVAVGYPHHITQRGNNRDPVFFDDQDRTIYLELLHHFTRKFQVDLWAYCLMTNHVHLLAVPQAEEAMALGIGRTNQVYTRHINRKYLRSGRLWQNRFYSCIVDTDEHLWSVARYIENNPVKAGLVSEAAEFRWSSARYHLHGEPDPLLSKKGWLNPNDREEYSLFFKENNAREVEMIRQATRSGRPYCCAKTLSILEDKLDRHFG